MDGMRKGRLSPEVMDELLAFIDSQETQGGGPDGKGPAVEVEIEAKPSGTHAMPDGSTMADSEMSGAKMCPHCGKSY